MHEEIVRKDANEVPVHDEEDLWLGQADVLAARVHEERGVRSGDVVTRTRRVDSLPGVVVTGRASLCLILLEDSRLMPGVRGDDAPSMDDFVIHAGLVAAFPRLAGPRTGEEGLCVIQAGRVAERPLPAGPRGGEDGLWVTKLEELMHVLCRRVPAAAQTVPGSSRQEELKLSHGLRVPSSAKTKILSW